MRDVIVKGDFSTFAEGIDGPFHSSAEYTLQEGQYFEQFIRGRIAKIWYWNDKPVYAELLQQPCVRGDGNRSIRQLIEIELDRRQVKRGDLLGDVSKMLAYQGLNLGTVPALDERVLADFRYGSVLTQQSDTEELDLTDASSAAALPPGVFETMQRIGALLWQEIPAETRELTAYTVDAILDGAGALHVLEVNCNPFMHPGVYATMLNDWIDNMPPKPLEPGMPAMEGGAAISGAASAGALSMPNAAQSGSAVLGLDELLAIAETELANQNFEAALLKAKNVLLQSPYETRALLLAARIYARIRLYPQAKAYYQKFMELQPNAVGALFELGLVHFDMNEVPEARTIWQQVLNFAPDFPPALFYSARISANNGAIDEARSLLETLLRTTPQEDPLFGHAQNFIQSLPSATQH
ncbi:MAG TPA: tetratricopeptide repeat protein [Rhodocyclaceae bacterium]|nr:tetratricopeptide repeat protein [Rhodocyclaceae bacterium]